MITTDVTDGPVSQWVIEHPEKLITHPNSPPQWQQWVMTWVFLPSGPGFFYYTELLIWTGGKPLPTQESGAEHTRQQGPLQLHL